MWLKFTADYDYRLPSSTIAYKAGWTGNVPARCATLAIAAGRAVRLKKTHKDEEPREWQSGAERDVNALITDKREPIL